MFRIWLENKEPKKERVKKVNVFDFDGTLVFTPLPEEGMPILNKEVLKKFMAGEVPPMLEYPDYWDDPISLTPPIIPEPTPMELLNNEIAHEFSRSSREPGTMTIVMTGRKNHLEPNVKRILDDFKLRPDRLYCRSPDCDTVNFKSDKLLELIKEFPYLDEMNVWEDRGPTLANMKRNPDENHIKKFKDVLNRILEMKKRLEPDTNFKFKVIEVVPRHAVLNFVGDHDPYE